MRFLLDQQVDAAVGRMLRAHSHLALTAAQLGMQDALDDELAVKADDLGAVMVTHDKEFSRRRRKNIIGRHLWLHCIEPDAKEVLEKHLDAVVAELSVGSNRWVSLSKTKIDVSMDWR